MNKSTDKIGLEDRLLSPRDVADRLGLDIRTVYRYIRSNSLRAAKFGRVYRISSDSLKEFVYKSMGQAEEGTLMEEELSRIIDLIKKEYKPEKILLFGSMAQGFKGAKDIDLLVVKQTDKRFYDRLREIAIICQARVPIDVLVYTPDEFKQEKESNIFFREEVLKKGKIIYDQAA